MYILPPEWNGCYFVRDGPYQGAVLKFKVEIPITYPLKSDFFPEVIFQNFQENKIWHPLIDELMGFLDLNSLKK